MGGGLAGAHTHPGEDTDFRVGHAGRLSSIHSPVPSTTTWPEGAMTPSK